MHSVIQNREKSEQNNTKQNKNKEQQSKTTKIQCKTHQNFLHNQTYIINCQSIYRVYLALFRFHRQPLCEVQY